MEKGIEDMIGEAVEQAKREIEGTIGIEADRIARQILHKLDKD